MLKVGDKAPPFAGENQRGEPLSLGGLLERGPLVLYFYPKDFTAVCTKEACLFQDAYEDLQGLGAEIVGVSVDGEDSHKRFAAEHGLGFSLLADPDRTVSKAYQVLRLFGVFTKRVTFVIDTDGTIRGVFHHELSAKKHVDEVRGLLRELGAGTRPATA